MTADALRVPVSDLLRHPGARRAHVVAAVVDDLAVPSAAAEREVGLELQLEAVSGGLLATGHLRGRWHAECARCLEPVHGDLDVTVRELFEPVPVEGETYPLGHEVVDLEPMVRDALVLELPLAPRHPEGTCTPAVPPGGGVTVDAPVVGEVAGEVAGSAPDPRWEALREVRFPSP